MRVCVSRVLLAIFSGRYFLRLKRKGNGFGRYEVGAITYVRLVLSGVLVSQFVHVLHLLGLGNVSPTSTHQVCQWEEDGWFALMITTGIQIDDSYAFVFIEFLAEG